MSKKGSGRRRAEENQRWHEQHEAERRRAEELAALQRQGVDGLHTVALPSINDGLATIDARGVSSIGRISIPIAPIRADPFVAPPRDWQPDFTRVERYVTPTQEVSMSYISNERVQPKEGSYGGGPKKVRVTLPEDIVEHVGLSKLTGMSFNVELTEEGILLRAGGAVRPVPLPAWASGSKERMDQAARR